jgi:hypothetical protein
LYLGGKFDAVSNNSSIKNIAAINVFAAPNFLDISWAPKVQDGGGGVNCIVPDQDIIYIGGDFGTINGVTTGMAGAINLADASIVSGWRPYPTKQPFGGIITTMSVYNSNVYLGGSQEEMTENINGGVFHLATVPGINTPLPVDWDYFNASKVYNGNLIQWNILTGNLWVEVQRSTDGFSFSTIEKLRTTGIGSFTDRNILKGQTYFYRLKLSDAQTFSYTSVKRLEGNHEYEGATIATLSEGNLNVITTGEGFQLQLFTVTGQCITNRRLNRGINVIPANTLTGGVYFYSITKGLFKSSGKIMSHY